MLNFFLQEGAEVAQDLEPVAQEKTLSIMDLLLTGGRCRPNNYCGTFCAVICGSLYLF